LGTNQLSTAASMRQNWEGELKRTMLRPLARP
jgi:hypothetical protein